MQQLTAQQIKRLRTITNLIVRYYQDRTTEGRFSFEITVLDRGDVILSALNIEGLRWFDTAHHCTVLIGKRGGIFSYDGNMLPKLVLPATPRLCKFTDPFKQAAKKQ